MEINLGGSPLIQNPSEVYHDHTLKGKGTKEAPLKVSVDGLNIVVDGDSGLVGEGTATNPLTIIPNGAILAEDGSPLTSEDGEFIIQEGYVQTSDIKRYTVHITQDGGTTAPTVLYTLENSIGLITFSYDGVGSYSIISDSLFAPGYVWCTGVTDNGAPMGLYHLDANTITLATDGELAGEAFIEIRVYPQP